MKTHIENERGGINSDGSSDHEEDVKVGHAPHSLSLSLSFLTKSEKDCHPFTMRRSKPNWQENNHLIKDRDQYHTKPSLVVFDLQTINSMLSMQPFQEFLLVLDNRPYLFVS